jgi:hypothetical protein
MSAPSCEKNGAGELVCTCCGGPVDGWTTVGRAAGFRVGVDRLYRAEHGEHWCGRPLDQYGECVCRAHGGDGTEDR